MLAETPAIVYASDWPMFHGDADNAGVTTDVGPLSLNGPYWDYCIGNGISMGAGIDVAPIVGDDKVYVMSYNGTVYAFDMNGSLAWKNAELGGQDSFIIGNPAYHDHVLYVALWLGNTTSDTGIHAIDTDDGHLVWSNNNFTKCQPITPIIYDDGMLYFGTWQRQTAFYGIDASTGAIVWARNSTTGGGYYWAGAAVIGNYLVYGDDTGHLTSVDKKTGAFKDDLNVSETFGVNAQEIRSSVAYDGGKGRIFFTSQGGYVYSLGFKNDTGMFDPSDKWNTYIRLSTSTPAIYDNRLYVGAGTFSTAGNAYCLDEADGAIIWNYTVNGGVQSSPVVSVIDGKAYVYFTSNCANGSAYCLDENGGLVWSFMPPAGKIQYLLCGVTISDGRAFFGNDAGYLFSLGTGQDGGPATPSVTPVDASQAVSGEAGDPYWSFLLALTSLAIGMAAYRRFNKK